MSNVNEQRDELAQVVMSVAIHPDLLDYRGGDYSNGAVCLGDARRIASKALAAGYRKPRTITTAEELDALPDWSAILDGSGDVGQKVGNWWHFPETSPMGSSKVAKYGPATVIHEPTPKELK